MYTYAEHYEKSKENWPIPTAETAKYKDLYDLTVDGGFLGDDPIYDDIIKRLAPKVAKKFDNNEGCVLRSTALYLNEWRDIPEVSELANHIMPRIETEIFHSNAHIEFVTPYRNTPGVEPEASWLWHYDDCPNEFLKFVVYLNEVDENNGCFRYLEDPDGSIPVISSRRVSPNYATPKQLYPGSRIPVSVIAQKVEEGSKVRNLVGPSGTYAIITPNIYHRATVPKVGTVPRDCVFFFIRPSMKSRESYISDETHSILPKRNVKIYNLD
tara:strand:+ start:1148 stop:1954 length:807 start_codon:yes stop_codon:yes gene_type:complete